MSTTIKRQDTFNARTSSSTLPSKSSVQPVSSSSTKRNGPGFFRRLFSKEKPKPQGYLSRIVHASASSPAIARRLESQVSYPKFQPLTIEFDATGQGNSSDLIPSELSHILAKDEEEEQESKPSPSPSPALSSNSDESKQRRMQVPRKPVSQGSALTGPVLTFLPRTGKTPEERTFLRKSFSQEIPRSPSLHDETNEPVTTHKQRHDSCMSVSSNSKSPRRDSTLSANRVSRISNFGDAQYMADIIRIESRDGLLDMTPKSECMEVTAEPSPFVDSSPKSDKSKPYAVESFHGMETAETESSDSDCVIIEMRHAESPVQSMSTTIDKKLPIVEQSLEDIVEEQNGEGAAGMQGSTVIVDKQVNAQDLPLVDKNVLLDKVVELKDEQIIDSDNQNEKAETNPTIVDIIPSPTDQKSDSTTLYSSMSPKVVEENESQSKPETPDSIASRIFANSATHIKEDEYAMWLGSEGEEQASARDAYMMLFNFKSKSILWCLRQLCSKLYMKGESQHLHRVIEAFSSAWCTQNPNHGFHDSNVVYTITYALVLLNTDLYGAEHTGTKKMTRSVFTQNTLETIKSQRPDLPNDNSHYSRRTSIEDKRRSLLGTPSPSSSSSLVNADTLLLVDEHSVEPFTREWDSILETVLRTFYGSVSQEQLTLHMLETAPFNSSRISNSVTDPSSTLNVPTSNSSPAIGNSASLKNVGLGLTTSGSSVFAKMGARLRSQRSQQYENQSRILAVNRNVGDGTGYRKNSLSSAFSVESGLTGLGPGRHASGFAGLLWNSLIQEGEEENNKPHSDVFSNFTEIQQELSKEVELELKGAPWAKEGILMYRPYIDPTTGKKPRKKDWIKVFVVVQRGQIRMYNFETSGSTMSSGDGNWLDRAQVVDGFHLCHTLSQELPALKRAQGFSALWSLQLPQRGLLVFKAGTSDIAQEFVYTCNYWAARLSKEPLEEAVSSFEYGWTVSQKDNTKSDAASVSSSRRISLRKQAMPGDKVIIKEWRATGHSMVVSDLNEDFQLTSLQNYVVRADTELECHAALRSKIAESFSPGTNNWTRAHNNWERKSQYLTQQSVRYKVYVETLQRATADKVSAEADIESSHNDKQSTKAEEQPVVTSSSTYSGSVYSNTSTDEPVDTEKAKRASRASNSMSLAHSHKLDEDETDYHSLDTNSTVTHEN